MAPSNKKSLGLSSKETHKQLRATSGLSSFDNYMKPPGSPRAPESPRLKVKAIGGGKQKVGSIVGVPVQYGGFSKSSSSSSLASSSKSKGSTTSLASSKSGGRNTLMSKAKTTGNSLAKGDSLGTKVVKGAFAVAQGLDIAQAQYRVTDKGNQQLYLVKNTSLSLFPKVPTFNLGK